MTLEELKKLLVLEDEDSVRSSLACFFEDEGFHVSAARSGEEALDLMKREKFSAAIVDIRLPGIEGDAFIRMAHDRIPAMKFIIYTGSGNFSLKEDLLKIGLTKKDIFYKPLNDLYILSDRIGQLI